MYYHMYYFNVKVHYMVEYTYTSHTTCLWYTTCLFCWARNSSVWRIQQFDLCNLWESTFCWQHRREQGSNEPTLLNIDAQLRQDDFVEEPNRSCHNSLLPRNRRTRCDCQQGAVRFDLSYGQQGPTIRSAWQQDHGSAQQGLHHASTPSGMWINSEIHNRWNFLDATLDTDVQQRPGSHGKGRHNFVMVQQFSLGLQLCFPNSRCHQQRQRSLANPTTSNRLCWGNMPQQASSTGIPTTMGLGHWQPALHEMQQLKLGGTKRTERLRGNNMICEWVNNTFSWETYMEAAQQASWRRQHGRWWGWTTGRLIIFQQEGDQTTRWCLLGIKPTKQNSATWTCTTTASEREINRRFRQIRKTAINLWSTDILSVNINISDHTGVVQHVNSGEMVCDDVQHQFKRMC